MRQETKIRNALIALYWAGHDDGRLCEKHDAILEHINLNEWANRRAKVINEALQKLDLPNKASWETALFPLRKMMACRHDSVHLTLGILRHFKKFSTP